ncbi:F-box domain-containing protein [Pleurotus pulmonarius]
MAESNRASLSLAYSLALSLPQIPNPPATLPPEIWCNVLSHLPPAEVMRIRRVNLLFYAVALDCRFQHFKIEGIADDDTRKFDALVRFIGAAMSPELAGRIKHITLCMDQLEMLQRFYAFTALGRTFSDNVAIPPNRTRALELISALFRVFENAWALNKVRLILCGTADRFAPFELGFTQEFWRRVSLPKCVTALELEVDVTKLELLLDLAPSINAPCLKELSIVIVRYWSRFPRETVDFRRIHGLFERLGPSLEALTFKPTIKRLTASAFDNDIVMPELRKLELDVRLGDLGTVRAINANYPALAELSLHVWMPEKVSDALWFSSLHLPNLRVLRVTLAARAQLAAIWGGALDAPRLEKLYLDGCFTRRSTPRELTRLCAFFKSTSVVVLEIEVAEIDDFVIDTLAMAFPNLQYLRISALKPKGREWPNKPEHISIREFHATWKMYLRREYFWTDMDQFVARVATVYSESV